jgi:hypothetical protein
MCVSVSGAYLCVLSLRLQVKSPSVSLHLAGTKRMQLHLSMDRGGVLERHTASKADHEVGRVCAYRYRHR